MQCAVSDCDRRVHARALCKLHWRRWRTHGDPLINVAPKRPTGLSLVEAFESFDKAQEGDCLIWLSALDDEGYGKLRWDGRTVKAHRIAYQLEHGIDLSSDVEIDHTCHRRACVAPSHLRVASRKQNAENHNGPRRDNTSGVRGVAWHRGRGQWQSSLSHNGVRHHLGYFADISAAETAVIEARLQMHTYNDQDRKVSA